MTSAPTSSSTLPGFRRWLDKLTDDELADVFRHRPDVAVPLPPSIAALATRLLLRTSVARALTTCNAAELAALERAASLGAEFTPVRSDAFGPTDAVAGLRARALIYADADRDHHADLWRLPAEIMPALPRGWTLLGADPISTGSTSTGGTTSTEVITRSLANIDGQQRKVLETLAAAGGVGTTHDGAPEADPARPIPRLIAAGLLERVNATTVRLPRAVCDAMRGRITEPIPLTPSERRGTPHPDEAADNAGAAAGFDAVREMIRVIDALAEAPQRLLKDKSLGVRGVAQLAKKANLSPDGATRLVGLGVAAGLIGRGEPTGYEGNYLAPTAGGYQWRDTPLAEQWTRLLSAWLSSPWATWRSSRGVDPETRIDSLTRQRRTVLQVYCTSVTALSADEHRQELHFSAPLFASHTIPATIAQLVVEAEWIGAIARGRATSMLLAAFSHAGPEPADAALLDVATALTPETTDRFIVQADMTVLAPSPLEPDVERMLTAMAEVESPGLASLYRISEASVRSGLDAGYAAEELATFLAEHALGEVPQPVRYLIGDVGRRHGTLRAGPALTYLRCADESLLAQAAHAVPQLRLLAPTVAVSTLDLGDLLKELRDAGFAPAAEDPTGATIDVRPEPAQVPPSNALAGTRQTWWQSAPDPERIRRAVGALRESQCNSEASGSPESTMDAHRGPDLDLIHAAARVGRTVRIGYADSTGTTRTLRATPVTVAGGQVDVTVAASQSSPARTLRIPLHRITEVELD